ncbi:hypothetical protein Mp_3g18920 [Marchantia polymorpha subsp. ruderalis]|uniref:Uncharacterized protein n=2 Tax=Marchantia polymorpha TaxID=3197 RepID=A0AAF6B2C9_MARPO|nr:hypothetical protein MARPO_0142s0003 [Marchantia polymorpha]BBN06163.1 hypothetical protein Mp_3g18920 [Marchantia polymorpha subsp. ruderalis]|eukprot:PTQ29371.1 hypothetical protein MARPO_0142s0003 [Marchantia polymorpha]
MESGPTLQPPFAVFCSASQIYQLTRLENELSASSTFVRDCHSELVPESSQAKPSHSRFVLRCRRRRSSSKDKENAVMWSHIYTSAAEMEIRSSVRVSQGTLWMDFKLRTTPD